jgi:hypothetical protein
MSRGMEEMFLRKVAIWWPESMLVTIKKMEA